MNTVAIGDAKLKMMKASIRCLVYGLLALVPVIGLPFGIAALWVSGRVRRQEQQLWNAAKPYRLVGVACGALATIGWAGVLIFVLGNLLLAALRLA